MCGRTLFCGQILCLFYIMCLRFNVDPTEYISYNHQVTDQVTSGGPLMGVPTSHVDFKKSQISGVEFMNLP